MSLMLGALFDHSHIPMFRDGRILRRRLFPDGAASIFGSIITHKV